MNCLTLVVVAVAALLATALTVQGQSNAAFDNVSTDSPEDDDSQSASASASASAASAGGSFTSSLLTSVLNSDAFQQKLSQFYEYFDLKVHLLQLARTMATRDNFILLRRVLRALATFANFISQFLPQEQSSDAAVATTTTTERAPDVIFGSDGDSYSDSYGSLSASSTAVDQAVHQVDLPVVTQTPLVDAAPETQPNEIAHGFSSGGRHVNVGRRSVPPPPLLTPDQQLNLRSDVFQLARLIYGTP